jgi:Rieske Fe-S protein
VADQENDKQGAPRRLEKPHPPGYFEGETMTRRGVFSAAVVAAGGLAGAVIVLPAVGFAVAPLFEEEDERWEAVGAADTFSPDSYRPVVITAVPGIGEAGKTTAYVRRGNPEITQGQSKYPPETRDEYIAISTRCAHLGCPVRYIQASQKFVCPCHGGIYDSQGKVEGGPPVRPLDRFYTRVTNGRVEVGDRFSLNSQLERFAPRDPSNHLDGLWQYLYPSRPTT